jgi:pimeloyl-ACP methyl ester carboxylesterase
MQWRKILMSGGAAIAGAATFNALAERDAAPLQNLIGGTSHTFEWRGYQVAYTVRGSGAPLLLVHSIHASAWSYEWRSNVDELARDHTVYTIDLLGFGLSDRPALRYSARLYLALIADFAADVVGAPCTLVASSLAAAYAIVLGARDPGRFPALVLVAPTGLVRLNVSTNTAGDVAKLGVEMPVVGTAIFNGMVSRRSIRAFLEQSYADDSRVTDEMVEVYYSTAHQAGAKHAPAAFMAWQLNVDVRNALRRLAQPALLMWGEHARIAPVEEVRGFLSAKPDFELAILDAAADLPHDECAAEFNELVSSFAARAARGELPAAGPARRLARPAVMRRITPTSSRTTEGSR